MLVPVKGTPLGPDAGRATELIRTIAVARILVPGESTSINWTSCSDEAQAQALAGANGSIFYGDELLTTPNNEPLPRPRASSVHGSVCLMTAQERFTRRLKTGLAERRAEHLDRALILPSGIDFTRNDYLGLANTLAHEDVTEVPFGSTASRVTSWTPRCS